MNSTLTNINASYLVSTYKNPKFWRGVLTDGEEFDVFEKVAWMQINWRLSIYTSLLYVGVIFTLQKWMKRRPAFYLKIWLILWNFSLALFSIKTAVIAFEEMSGFLHVHGLDWSICGTINEMSPRAAYWALLFLCSKFLELGDTLFLVLRKRKLIFLHWYHHLTVLMMACVSMKDLISTTGWCITLNATVHGVMYTYFTLRAVGFKIPTFVAMAITATQLGQFVIGLGIHGYAIGRKWMGHECNITDSYVYLIFSIGFTYLYLFGKFFFDSYLSGAAKKKLH